MSILLSDAELNILHEQHEYYFKLYVHALRRYMDYSTGIVGSSKRRISYQSIREEMYVAPRRGFSRKETGMQTKSDIRRALKHLEKLGLIEKIKIKNEDDHLIFKCCLAVIGNPRLKLSRHISDTQPDTKENTPKKPLNLDKLSAVALSEKKAGTQPDIPSFSKPTHLCISGKDKEKELLRSSKKKTQWPTDFKVKEHHIQMAAKNQWPDPHHEFEAFKDYHLSHGSTFLDWDRAFYTWLRNAKRFKERTHGSYQQTSKQPNSVTQVVNSILRRYPKSQN